MSPALLGCPVVQVVDVAFSRCGDALLSATSEGVVKLWHSQSGQLRRCIVRKPAARRARFSHRGSRVFALESELCLCVWDAATGEQLFTSPAVRSIGAGGSAGGSSSSRKKELHEPLLEMSGDRAVVAVLDALAVWHAVTYSLLWIVDRAHMGEPISLLSVSTQASAALRVLTGTSEGHFRVWNLEAGQLLRSMEGPPGAGTISCLCMAAETGVLATGSSVDGLVRVWTAADGLLWTLADQSRGSSSVDTICISRDGRYLAAGSPHDKWKIRVWRLPLPPSPGVGGAEAAGASEAVPELLPRLSGTDAIIYRPTALRMADSDRLIAYFRLESVCIWELPSGRWLRRLPQREFVELALSGNGRRLALFPPRGPGFVVKHAWTGDVLATATIEEAEALGCSVEDEVTCVCLSESGDTVVTGLSASGKIQVSRQRGARGCTDSLTDTPLVVRVGVTCQLWDSQTCRLRGSLEGGHEGRVTAVAMAGEAPQLVASGGADRACVLWDAGSGEKLCVLPQPEAVLHVQLSVTRGASNNNKEQCLAVTAGAQLRVYQNPLTWQYPSACDAILLERQGGLVKPLAERLLRQDSSLAFQQAVLGGGSSSGGGEQQRVSVLFEMVRSIHERQGDYAHTRQARGRGGR